VVRHVPLPAEIERHHIWPAYDQIKKHGKVIDDTRANLCPTAHTNVHAAIRRQLKGENFTLGNVYQRRIAEEGLRKIREIAEPQRQRAD